MIIGWDSLCNDLKEKIVMEFLDFDDICSIAKLSEKFNKKVYHGDGKRILERLFDTVIDEKIQRWEIFYNTNLFFTNIKQQENLNKIWTK